MKKLNDGTGRVCVHWFIHDPNGPIKTQGGAVLTILGPLAFPGASGRIACRPEQNALYQIVGNEIMVCKTTDDARAAVCPACLATPEYAAKMAEFKKETVYV